MSPRADLQQIIDEIDATGRAADALVTPLTDAQFHFSLPGRWSIAQCIDHLATMNVVYSRPIGEAVEAARQKGLTGGGPIAPTFFGRRFIASQEPPVKRRLRTPSQAQPRSTASRDEMMRAYHASHDTIRAIARSCAGIDVNRATYPNPFIPLVRMRVGTGLRILAAHERRHLWQAEQVRKAEGFPR
jgi:DinB superfamily